MNSETYKTKTYTITKWCSIFGVCIIDNDGFKGIDIDRLPVTLEFFIDGISKCTINPINKDKFSVLTSL